MNRIALFIARAWKFKSISTAFWLDSYDFKKKY